VTRTNPVKAASDPPHDEAVVCPPEVINLVRIFDQDKGRIYGAGYKEEHLKQEFLEPLFRALGWNTSRVSEVTKEYSLSSQRSTKSVDYAFLIKGKPRFLVEAKRPAEDMTNRTEPAYQLRNYGWNLGLSLSVLTDFQDLVVYDTSFGAKEGESPVKGRLLRISRADLEAKWYQIWNLLSKKAVEEGSLDVFWASQRGRKETERVDEAFLGDIEDWRMLLAKNLVSRNSLSTEELSGAVQGLLDRLVFCKRRRSIGDL
jgi:hypothetical protein